MRFAAFIALIWMAAACVPMSGPSPLDHTPGPAITVTDRVYDSGSFRVRYPAGWRVITSAAGGPVYAIFAAPADDAVIVVGGTIPDVPLEGATRSDSRQIDLGNGRQINAALHAPLGDWARYEAVFETVVDSLR